MNLFKLSNQIFTLGLDAKEMSVYAYLCSLPASETSLTGESIISVKQWEGQKDINPPPLGVLILPHRFRCCRSK